MNKSKASGVSWVKPTEPSFLTKFKKDVGFKEGPTVDTKRQVMPELGDDSGSDKEDEQPQVVVLQGGDLTAEEVKEIKEVKARDGADKDTESSDDAKIVFKKPNKSSTEKFQGIRASSSNIRASSSSKRKSDGGEKEEEKEEKSAKKVKNSSLLSFGEDEEEEEEFSDEF